MSKSPNNKTELSIENNKCSICATAFENRRVALRHLKYRTDNCKKIESLINKAIEDSMQKLKSVYEQRINIIEEKKNNVIEKIVNAPGAIKEKRQVVQNLDAEDKIQNFEKVVYCTTIPKEILRNTVELMADGDVILFRRIFIDHVEPQYRCIRIKDFARDKYQYFDGTEWITTTLTYLIEHFANELHKKYKYLIFEKSDRITDVDRMYPPRVDPERNAAEIDEITMRYAKITEHVTKLGINDADFINEIKRGVRGIINKPMLIDKKDKLEYDENLIEPDDLDSYSDSDDDGDNGSSSRTDKLLDQSVLIPFLRMIGYDFKLLL
jgi:hypothetical protein